MKGEFKIVKLTFERVIIIVIIIISFILIIITYKEGGVMLKSSYKDIYNINVTKERLDDMEDKLNIIHVRYCWNEELDYINKPVLLIYHHTAINSISVEDVDKLHKDRGFAGIGYNYYIDKSGLIYKGRPDLAQGAHALGKNKVSLGICLEGNFEEEYPTEKQIESLEKLSIFLCLKYDIKGILGHKEVQETLCPGKNFPLNEIRNNVIVRLRKIKSC